MRGPIVVGADGSANSRLAIEEAGAIATATGQPIIVVFVRRPAGSGLGAAWMGAMSIRAIQDVTTTQECLAEAQSIAILDSAGLTWRFESRTGEPARELMRVAGEAGAETIVVAGRRHGALGSVTTGAVCTQLLHRWPGSLLVIHPPSDSPAPPAHRPTGEAA
jgi:nucleotide-binding universal stress UspA family protein